MQTFIRRTWLVIIFIPAFIALVAEGLTKSGSWQWIKDELVIFKQMFKHAWTGDME